MPDDLTLNLLYSATYLFLAHYFGHHSLETFPLNPHTRRLRKHRRQERRLEHEQEIERARLAARSRAAQPKPKQKILAVPPASASGGALLATMLKGALPSPPKP